MVSFKQPGNSKRWALAAACAGTLLLAGCDMSTYTPAEQASRDAAGLTRSAGEPRATDALVEAVASGVITKPGEIKPGQVMQNGADKDFDAASKQLTGAIGLPDLSPLTKSGLQSQLGGVQLLLSQYRLGLLQNDIQNLSGQAALIQPLAQSAHHALELAKVLETGAKPPSQDEKNKAAAQETTRQQALTAADALVKNLQSQIAAKEAEARKIYADTDAAYAAADALHGQAAIAAGNKAMADRKQAEELMFEAGNLAPELARAEAEQALAQVALTDAKELSRLASDAYAHEQEAAQQNAARVAVLRKAAATIIGDDAKPETLKGRLKTFMELAAKIDKQVRDGAAAADQAASSYAAAATSYRSHVDDTTKKADDAQLDTNDPLRKVIKDERPAVLLAWSQSAAQQQAGRVFLAGAQAANLISGVVQAAATANLAQAADSSLDGTRCRTEAATRFTNAAKLTHDANARSPQPASDVDRIRWIGLSLEATANEGLAATGTSAALQTAISLRKDAVTRNPALESQLSWIGQ